MTDPTKDFWQGTIKMSSEVIECLVAAWETDKNANITPWNMEREAEARAAEEAEQKKHTCQKEDQERIA